MRKSNKAIGLLGAGGKASEIADYVNARVVFMAVQFPYLHDELVNIERPTDDQKNTPVVAAVGSPLLKHELVQSWPGKTYTTIITENAYVGSNISIGSGSIIAPGAILTSTVTIGKHVLVNVGATISHNTNIGNFVTIGPGAHIGGHVNIEDGAFIGIGASVKNGVSIANGAVLGAGAVLLNDITEENSVYVGVPARKIRTNKEWLSEI